MPNNKKPINIDIGLRIKKCREAAGLTQSAFSEKVELSVKTISSIERGVTGISLVTLVKICEVLSISADDILFEHTNIHNTNTITNKLQDLSDEEFKITVDIIHKIIEGFNLKDEKKD